MEDKEFEAFLNQLRSNTPNMSVIKDGLEKFGSGALSDAQKEAFFKTLYPDNHGQFGSGSHYSAYGFENVSRIKTVVAAVVEMQKEGKINAEQIKAVLAPEGERNALTALSSNAYAGDFKMTTIKGQTNKEVQKANQEMAEALQQNGEEISETLGIVAQLDGRTLKELIEISSKEEPLGRILTDPEKYRKSEKLSEFMSSAEERIAEGGVTIEETGTTRVGGEGVTVVPTPPEGVDIKEEEEDKKKVANIAKAPGDHSRSQFKPEIVREQDIIKYMFEKWFLEFMVSGSINLVNKVVDGAIGYLAEHLDMPARNAEHITPNSTSAKYLKKTAKSLETACDQVIDPQNNYYRALHSCLSANVGKDLGDWQIPEVNGRKVLDFSDARDKAIAESFKALYEANPEQFKERMSAMDGFLASEKKQITTLLKTAATLALVEHLSSNPDKELTAGDEARIRTRMFVIAEQIKEGMKKLAMQAEIDYRISHHLSPDAALSDADKTAILQLQQKATTQYAKELAENANDTQKHLKKYFNASTEDEKETYRKKITNDNVERANLLEGRKETTFLTSSGHHMTLQEAGRDEAAASFSGSAWDGKLFTLGPTVDPTAHEARKRLFQEKVSDGSEITASKAASDKTKKSATADAIIRNMGPSGMFK